MTKKELERWEERLFDAKAMMESTKSMNAAELKYLPSLIAIVNGIVDSVREEITLTLLKLETSSDERACVISDSML